MDPFENLMESHGFLLQRNEHDHTRKMLCKSHATHVHISGNLRPLENAGLVTSTANARPEALLFLHLELASSLLGLLWGAQNDS